MNQNEPVDLSEPPTDDSQFRRELASLLNRHGVDNWAEIPDHILAGILADMVHPIRWGRIATAKWMGQPLLGEKLAASIVGGPEVEDRHTFVRSAGEGCWVCGEKPGHRKHHGSGA